MSAPDVTERWVACDDCEKKIDLFWRTRYRCRLCDVTLCYLCWDKAWWERRRPEFCLSCCIMVVMTEADQR